jgi:hypothetical protein
MTAEPQLDPLDVLDLHGDEQSRRSGLDRRCRHRLCVDTFTVGEAVLRGIVARVGVVEGSEGLQRLTVEFALKLAELTERIATLEQLAAIDLADLLFLD